MNKFSDKQKGPSIILNSGSVANINLSNTNKYGKYDLRYVVGIGNLSYTALTDTCERLAIKNNRKIAGVKMPWHLDEQTKMVTIRASGKQRPPVMDTDKRVIPANSIKDGDFAKINVTPCYYEMKDTGSYILPDGTRQVHTEVNKGITLFLNGVLLLSGQGTEEELF